MTEGIGACCDQLKGFDFHFGGRPIYWLIDAKQTLEKPLAGITKEPKVSV